MTFQLTDLLEVARSFEGKADAEDILGDPVPVRRKDLQKAVDALRGAYTELQREPDLDTIAQDRIEGLEKVARWLYSNLDGMDVPATINPGLLEHAAFLWREEE